MAIIIITGIGFFIVSATQFHSQKAELATLQQTLKKNNEQINELAKKNASESAQIKSLINQPTPTDTPIITEQTTTSANTFTCVDPTEIGWNPSPCIVSDASNGICEDTKNGAVFSCDKATRLSNTYNPIPTSTPTPNSSEGNPNFPAAQFTFHPGQL